VLNGTFVGSDRLIVKPASLSDAERQKLLVEWNETGLDYPHDACVQEMIEAQVQQTPQAIAVVCGDQQLSYSRLNAQANQLAHYLRKLGAGPGQLVGICIERSLAMVVSLLATLKSGAAYVPLDPHYPVDRLSWMVQDSGLKVLITQEKTAVTICRLPGPTGLPQFALDQHFFRECRELPARRKRPKI